MTDNLWKTSTFREAVTSKINEAIRQTPIILDKTDASEQSNNGEILEISDLLSFEKQEAEGCSDNKTDFGDLDQSAPHNIGQLPNQLRNQLSDLNHTQVSSPEVSNEEEQVQGQVSLVNRTPTVSLVNRTPTPLGLPLVNASAVGKKAPNDLVELATAIQKADTFTQANACNKLQVIVQQIRFLQHQAENILKDAKLNQDLHHVPCNFVKVPGKIYYLYQKPDGEQYFSMISPEEWQTCPNQHIGSYRLEYDQSWTPIQNIAQLDSELSIVNTIFDCNMDMFALQQ